MKSWFRWRAQTCALQPREASVRGRLLADSPVRGLHSNRSGSNRALHRRSVNICTHTVTVCIVGHLVADEYVCFSRGNHCASVADPRAREAPHVQLDEQHDLAVHRGQEVLLSVSAELQCRGRGCRPTKGGAMRKATKASWPVRLHSARSCILSCDYNRCVAAPGIRGA